jgi:hypothetical protein
MVDVQVVHTDGTVFASRRCKPEDADEERRFLERAWAGKKSVRIRIVHVRPA